MAERKRLDLRNLLVGEYLSFLTADREKQVSVKNRIDEELLKRGVNLSPAEIEAIAREVQGEFLDAVCVETYSDGKDESSGEGFDT